MKLKTILSFSDFDGNGFPEIVATTDEGTVSLFHLDGNLFHHFPISHDLPFTGPPMIVDLDGDESEATVEITISDVIVVPPGERGCDCAPLYSSTNFKNPTLVSGSSGQVGAVYRFSNVFCNIFCKNRTVRSERSVVINQLII